MNVNHLLVHVSGELSEIYGNIGNTYGCGPDRPWDLIFGFDEFSPGSALKPLNQKKNMVVSFNFKQVGKRLLSREDTWMTPMVIRHTVLAAIKGGFPRILRDYLKLHLIGSCGAITSGIPLVVNGAPMLVFVRVQGLLADGDGWRLSLNWRGAFFFLLRLP